MLDLLKDCCNCFLLSFVKKFLNEHVMYYNFSFTIFQFFLLKKVFKFYQVYYTILFIAFESFLFLGTFSVFL